MAINIDDLPLELLEYILDFLQDKQLFQIERVSRKWNVCVLKKLARKKSLINLDHYSQKFKFDDSSIKYIINNDNIDILKKILTKRNNIKHLDLSSTKVIGKCNLIEIAKLCPKLESIDLRESEFCVKKDEIDEFAKTYGPQIIKCNLGFCENEFMATLFKQIINIEEISFRTWQYGHECFHHLDVYCKKLKVLKWGSLGIDINHYMINVMQKVQHLKIEYVFLSMCNFELNNLTQLTIDGGYSNFIENFGFKTFTNLKRLNIYNFYDFEFESISTFNFPKLESSLILPNLYCHDIPTSFINQVKHIRSLYYHSAALSPSIISYFDQLNSFTWNLINLNDGLSFTQLFQCFEILSKLERLDKIKFQIQVSNMKIKKYFFHKLINFSQSKPNTKFEIVIDKKTSEFGKNFGDFKNLFEETKHLHHLNMEMNFKN